ncbi:MAG: chemotaxis protein CheW [Gammaproteobacteria bacterium]
MAEALETARPPHELMDLLLDLEERFRTGARQLPELELSDDRWQGLAFTVAGVRLVSAMQELAEMLPYPHMITRVPGARDWVVGLANVRGTLLPITDLQAFLGGKAQVPGKGSRVLVLPRSEINAGLLVPGVQGMQQFDRDCRVEARLEGPVGQYVNEAFKVDDELWPVFGMQALADDPRFLAAGT